MVGATWASTMHTKKGAPEELQWEGRLEAAWLRMLEGCAKLAACALRTVPEHLRQVRLTSHHSHHITHITLRTVPEHLRQVRLTSHHSHHITHITLRTVCLLYTSPSPRDRTRTRMPSSA